MRGRRAPSRSGRRKRPAACTQPRCVPVAAHEGAGHPPVANRRGVVPTSRVKCRCRCAWSWKPTATATWAIGSPSRPGAPPPPGARRGSGVGAGRTPGRACARGARPACRSSTSQPARRVGEACQWVVGVQQRPRLAQRGALSVSRLSSRSRSAPAIAAGPRRRGTAEPPGNPVVDRREPALGLQRRAGSSRMRCSWSSRVRSRSSASVRLVDDPPGQAQVDEVRVEVEHPLSEPRRRTGATRVGDVRRERRGTVPVGAPGQPGGGSTSPPSTATASRRTRICSASPTRTRTARATCRCSASPCWSWKARRRSCVGAPPPCRPVCPREPPGGYVLGTRAAGQQGRWRGRAAGESLLRPGGSTPADRAQAARVEPRRC